jgi:hypothetical protein
VSKSTLSKQDFIRLTVANTLGEYLRQYQCNPAQIKKIHARCINDAEMLADELWGTTEVNESPLLSTGE